MGAIGTGGDGEGALGLGLGLVLPVVLVVCVCGGFLGPGPVGGDGTRRRSSRG